MSEILDAVNGVVFPVWFLIGAALVFFMQGGFAMVETGFTRAKNAGNIIMKNLMDFCIGSIVFWAIGWGFMYGADRLGGFVGFSDFFKGPMSDPLFYRDWFFQVVFAATAATIVSGAMAERTQFKSYLIYTAFISAFIYPVSGHWIWGGGWLSSLGFHDFAGSTVVHSVGGWAALMGAAVLGPRAGKYVRADGKISVKAFPGHNIPLAALGVFILWFGWYGFNPGSTLSGLSLDISRVAVTTTLAASAGACSALFFSWILFKKPDASNPSTSKSSPPWTNSRNPCFTKPSAVSYRGGHMEAQTALFDEHQIAAFTTKRLKSGGFPWWTLCRC